MIWPGRLFRLAVLLYVQTLVVLVAVEFLWPRDVIPAEAGAIVCLGGNATETELARNSRLRAERCVELFQAGAAPAIVFTGVTAAPLMADVARTSGVPEEAIAVEALSRSTLQNALFTARLIAPETHIIVVSDAYHLPRSWIAFRVMGFDDLSLNAAGSPILRPRQLLREALAMWFNAGRVVLWWTTPWLGAEVREALLI